MHPEAEFATSGYINPPGDLPESQGLASPALGTAGEQRRVWLVAAADQTGQGTDPRDAQPFSFTAVLCVPSIQIKLVPSSSSQTGTRARPQAREGEKGCDSAGVQDIATCKAIAPRYLELRERVQSGKGGCCKGKIKAPILNLPLS